MIGWHLPVALSAICLTQEEVIVHKNLFFPKQISYAGVLAVLIESPWRWSITALEGVG